MTKKPSSSGNNNNTVSDNVILWNMNEKRNETDGVGDSDREKES